MIPQEHIPHELQVESEALDHDLADLQSLAPVAMGETLAWIGSKGRGRWLLVSWLNYPPRLTLGIWTEDHFGSRFPVRHGAVTVRLWEIPKLARAILFALARARTAASERHTEQAEYTAERRAGGGR